jgi:hypothetical protein
MFKNSASALFSDIWYHLLWTSEMLWNQPKNSDTSTLTQRTKQFETAVNRHFFEVDVQLTEKLKNLDSLQMNIITSSECFRPVQLQTHIADTNYLDNKTLFNKALGMEQTLLFFIDNFTIQHDDVLFSMLFATQRIEFIALKRLLQENCNNPEQNNSEYQRKAVKLLQDNIFHLKTAHETLWQIENNSVFPQSIISQYDTMFSELTTLAETL